MKKLFLTIITLFFSMNSQAQNNNQKNELATFAGGCFWCMQPVFDEMPGVISTKVGYSGGDKPNPTYDDVSSGQSGHFEVIQIEFDAKIITFEALLDKFIRNIDPINPEGQFYDKGPQYQTAVLYHSQEQKNISESYFKKLKESKVLKGEVATALIPFKAFYEAENYHQKYYQKNAVRYELYKIGSGRKKKLHEIWGE